MRVGPPGAFQFSSKGARNGNGSLVTAMLRKCRPFNRVVVCSFDALLFGRSSSGGLEMREQWRLSFSGGAT
eukprot:scaffold1918_cov154-Amphora_coffeaeformis.AAC.14